jgi:alkylhydroperoxidase family enzyme
VGRDNGVSDEKLLDLEKYVRSPHYSERERVALEYADRVTITSEDVDDALFDRLSSFYTPEEIAELTCTIAFENFLSKFHHALLVEPHGFCPIPVLDHEAAGRSAAR